MEKFLKKIVALAMIVIVTCSCTTSARAEVTPVAATTSVTGSHSTKVTLPVAEDGDHRYLQLGENLIEDNDCPEFQMEELDTIFAETARAVRKGRTLDIKRVLLTVPDIYGEGTHSFTVMFPEKHMPSAEKTFFVKVSVPIPLEPKFFWTQEISDSMEQERLFVPVKVTVLD